MVVHLFGQCPHILCQLACPHATHGMPQQKSEFLMPPQFTCHGSIYHSLGVDY